MTDIISRAKAKAQGLKRYFTGKPCKQGHTVERNTASGHCMECDRVRANEFRINNPEVISERGARYYKENIESVRTRVKSYQQTEAGKANRAATNKAWWEANKAQHQATVNAWGKANKGLRAAHAAARRTLGHVDLTSSEKAAIKALYTERDRLNAEAGCIAFHVDHITPLSKGGAHHPDNLQILSAEENLSKGAKLDFEKGLIHVTKTQIPTHWHPSTYVVDEFNKVVWKQGSHALALHIKHSGQPVSGYTTSLCTREELVGVRNRIKVEEAKRDEESFTPEEE